MSLSTRQTGAILIAIFVLGVAALLILETLTLADSVPNNHITAIIRSAWEGDGDWVILWLVGSIGYLGGHFFASRKQKCPLCPHCLLGKLGE